MSARKRTARVHHLREEWDVSVLPVIVASGEIEIGNVAIEGEWGYGRLVMVINGQAATMTPAQARRVVRVMEDALCRMEGKSLACTDSADHVDAAKSADVLRVLTEPSQASVVGTAFGVPASALRIASLVEELSAGGLIDVHLTASRYGVSPRTVQRYLRRIHRAYAPLTRLGTAYGASIYRLAQRTAE